MDPAELSAGTYQAFIYVYSSGEQPYRSYQTVSVILEVVSPEGAGLPFGEWDKPREFHMSYKGCFPFSGWALDKIGIESVKIFRSRASFDYPSSPEEIYIGNAFFVEGARADVEELYPYYPQSSRAGWGYDLISDILPGDCLYTFLVRARSMSGAEVDLGRRTIHIDNGSSLSPFGDIRVPSPDEKISSSFYHVSGWALSKGQSDLGEVDYKKTLSPGLLPPENKLFFLRFPDEEFRALLRL